MGGMFEVRSIWAGVMVLVEISLIALADVRRQVVLDVKGD